MRRNTKGSAQIIAAGGGLLALVVVVAIMLSLSSKSASTVSKAKKTADKELSNDATGDFAVVLEDVGMDETGVVQALRQLTDISEADARALLGRLPATIATDLTRIQADRYAKELIVTGATARIVQREQP